MPVRIWKGELKIPVKTFYLILLILFSAFLIYVEVIIRRGRKITEECRKLPLYSNSKQSKGNGYGEYISCSKDPIIYNTPESCPKCFRTTVEAISKNFSAVTYFQKLFPRGPPGYFKPRATRQQDLVEDVLISPTSVCVDVCPFLLAVQLSITDRSEDRNTIRMTWGSVAKTKIWPHANLNADMQILFVLAHQSVDSSGKSKSMKSIFTSPEWSRVKAEADRHGDLLYLDMIDSYYNLSLKLISTFHWVQHHCPRTKFILKVDADTYINVPLLTDLLIRNEPVLEFSVTGYLYSDTRSVFRNGRWAVSKHLYPMHMYPVYASGCAYVVSASAMFTMVEVAPYMPVLPIEDAYVTGLLVRSAGVQMLVNGELFTHFKDFFWQRCQMVIHTKVAGTFAGGPRARDIWSAVLEKNETCFEEDYSSEFEKYYKLIVVDE